MSVFDIIKKNTTWNAVEKAFTATPISCKVEANTYNSTDSNGRKALLQNCFSKAIAEAVGNDCGNLTCFNGKHEDKTPSMVFDFERAHFHCYGCMDYGKNYDLFNAISDLFGLEGYMACYKKAEELFVKDPEKIESQKYRRPYPLEMYKVMKNNYYTPISQSPEGLEYMREKRGISEKTCINNGLMVWEYNGCGYLVFINDNGSYVRRLIYKAPEASYYSFEPSKWWNSKGKGGFFNERAIDSASENNEIVFVFESAIDALTAQELGYKAVGLNSVLRFKALLQEHDYPYLVIMFDNDLEGQN